MVHENTVEAKAEVIDETQQADQEKDAKSLVDAVFDVGTAWAEYGLGWGKFALENTARALKRTADGLGTVAQKLKDEKTNSS
jgi:hypothetical protein